MSTFRLAFDKSARHLDDDGRLHVERSHISKAVVSPYYGQEIPGYEELGLDPSKIYQLYRDPVELERGAETFARLPILNKHTRVTVENVADDPELKQLIVGAIGSNVTFTAPYLDADLCIWDAAAIAGIEQDRVRELSCSYYYIAVMEPGEIDGKSYDGKMTQIRGNHLALVEVGRAGSDVVVADANPFINKDTPAMKMTKLGKALFAALSAASPKLAADSALSALVGEANRKTFKIADVKSKLLAIDASIDSTKLDNILDAILDVEQEPNAVEPPKVAGAADASPEEKVKGLLAGKVDDSVIAEICGMLPAAAAADEKPDDGDKPEPGMKKDEVKAAMDAFSVNLRAQLKEANEAARDVRHVVGDLAMDSAAEIYGFALDKMNIDHKGIDSTIALRQLFKVASASQQTRAPVVAQDSAGLVAQFPQAGRFGRA